MAALCGLDPNFERVELPDFVGDEIREQYVRSGRGTGRTTRTLLDVLGVAEEREVVLVHHDPKGARFLLERLALAAPQGFALVLSRITIVDGHARIEHAGRPVFIDHHARDRIIEDRLGCFVEEAP